MIDKGSDYLLEFSDLTIRQGGRLAVDHVTGKISRGKWISVVGANGAGKSTFLRAIAGLQTFEGEVRLNGISLEMMKSKQRAQCLAWMGQNEHVSVDASVFDLVMLGRLPYQDLFGASNAYDEKIVQEILVQTHSWSLRNRLLGELSAGERQRVLLARTLCSKAPLLLFDEPLTNLDAPHQADWIAQIRQLTERGVTVISVLHELNVALCADEMMLFQDGKLVEQAGCHSHLLHQALELIFDKCISIHQVNGRWVVLFA